MIYATLVLWEKLDGERFRELESKSFKVDELDLQYLPAVTLDLGSKILEGMTLEVLGHRRSTAEVRPLPDKE